MNISAIQSSSSTSNSMITLRKRKQESITDTSSKRARFMASYCRQSFSLPDSVMHYIAKNPSSSKVYEKFVKCCKYFYIKNPLLIVDNLSYDEQNGWKATFQRNQKPIDMDKFTCKFWITNELFIKPSDENNFTLASSIVTRIYHCDIKSLKIWTQHLSFEELLAISSNAKDVLLHGVVVKHQNGSVVQFEKIFEAFSYAKRIRFYSPSAAITSKTFPELLKLPHFLLLDLCELYNIPDVFDIDNFTVYLKKNKHTKFCFYFSDSISDAFRNRLDKIADEIIAAENRDYKCPIFNYRGLDTLKSLDMISRFCQDY